MWFDGLTNEEIHERLLKEGIFTPLLQAANIDQEVLEEAAQQAPLSVEEKIELMRSFAEDILLPWLDRMAPPETGE
jgi:hypothetical protein